MFYIKLNKIKILNNREFLGKGEVQIMSFITTGNEQLPQLQGFYKAMNQKEKEEWTRSMVETVLGWRILTPVYKIRDHHQLFFGDTGFVVFKSETIPEDFNWQLLAIELDEKTRQNADLAEMICSKENNHSKIINFIQNHPGGLNPIPGVVNLIIEIVARALPKVFKNDRDDQIGLFIASLNRKEHYPHGCRDRQDVPDLSGNMFVDYTIFGFENSVD